MPKSIVKFSSKFTKFFHFIPRTLCALPQDPPRQIPNRYFPVKPGFFPHTVDIPVDRG